MPPVVGLAGRTPAATGPDSPTFAHERPAADARAPPGRAASGARPGRSARGGTRRGGAPGGGPAAAARLGKSYAEHHRRRLLRAGPRLALPLRQRRGAAPRRPAVDRPTGPVPLGDVPGAA